MRTRNICCYKDFVAALLEAGFSMGGGNSEGIFSLIPWSWNEPPPYETPVKWHTGDRETDPWEWRIRVLEEEHGIGYGKIFFKKSGYITREWAPCLIAARRGNVSFEEEYSFGTISNSARRIYSAVQKHGALPLHAIKQLAGFGREEKPAFDRALVQLQTNMYISMCGSRQKTSRLGQEYGWSSTVFCTTESFWGNEVFEEAAKITPAQGTERMLGRIRQLNPQVNEKKALRFIGA